MLVVRLYRMVVFATSSALACAGVALAQPVPEAPPEAADVEQAVALFEVAERRYQEGRFEEAVSLLLEARGLHREAVLSYNLGRAYEELDRIADAIDAYRQYLLEAPDARDRRAVEARIERLEAHVARANAPPPVRTPVLALPLPEESGGPSAWPFVFGGVGLAGVGAGVLFGALSVGSRDDAAADPVHESSRQSFRDAETLALSANVAWIAGGGVLLASLVWLVIDLVSSDEPSRDLALLRPFDELD
jgi:tetratricopeptide (TPR) repeat protein